MMVGSTLEADEREVGVLIKRRYKAFAGNEVGYAREVLVKEGWKGARIAL